MDGACRRGHLRRADERQRSRRFRPRGDRLDRRHAEGGRAVPRHLPRRADAGEASRRHGLRPLRRLRRDRLLRAPRDRGRASGSSSGRTWSINGTARASTCRPARRCLRAATFSRTRRFRSNGTAFGIQFHSELTYAMACRWTVRGAERFELPMAQSRAEHMAGWFRYDPPIRAWLWNFLDVWLAQDRARVARRSAPLSALGFRETASSRSSRSPRRPSRTHRPRRRRRALDQHDRQAELSRRDDLGAGLAAGILRDDPADPVLFEQRDLGFRIGGRAAEDDLAGAAGPRRRPAARSCAPGTRGPCAPRRRRSRAGRRRGRRARPAAAPRRPPPCRRPG